MFSFYLLHPRLPILSGRYAELSLSHVLKTELSIDLSVLTVVADMKDPHAFFFTGCALSE